MNDGEPIFGQLPAHYNAVPWNGDGVLRNLRFWNSNSKILEQEGPRVQFSSDAEMTECLRVGKAPKLEDLQARDVVFEKNALAWTSTVEWNIFR
jgi:hypothetical protein